MNRIKTLYVVAVNMPTENNPPGKKHGDKSEDLVTIRGLLC